MEQRLPELIFERLDLAADRRLGHEQLLGGSREAQVACGGTKAAQEIERDSRSSMAIHYKSSYQE
jgi:hypothetical protein